MNIEEGGNSISNIKLKDFVQNIISVSDRITSGLNQTLFLQTRSNSTSWYMKDRKYFTLSMM